LPRATAKEGYGNRPYYYSFSVQQHLRATYRTTTRSLPLLLPPLQPPLLLLPPRPMLLMPAPAVLSYYCIC
jgi:hypothetical protein